MNIGNAKFVAKVTRADEIDLGLLQFVDDGAVNQFPNGSCECNEIETLRCLVTLVAAIGKLPSSLFVSKSLDVPESCTVIDAANLRMAFSFGSTTRSTVWVALACSFRHTVRTLGRQYSGCKLIAKSSRIME